MTNKQLRGWYLRYNRRYFNNELPRDLATVFVPIPDNMGGCVFQFKGAHREFIAIDEQTKDWDLLVRFTLLHEMVHIKLPNRCGHCKHFDDEMLRLAHAGAFKGLW